MAEYLNEPPEAEDEFSELERQMEVADAYRSCGDMWRANSEFYTRLAGYADRAASTLSDAARPVVDLQGPVANVEAGCSDELQTRMALGRSLVENAVNLLANASSETALTPQAVQHDQALERLQARLSRLELAGLSAKVSEIAELIALSESVMRNYADLFRWLSAEAAEISEEALQAFNALWPKSEKQRILWRYELQLRREEQQHRREQQRRRGGSL